MNTFLEYTKAILAFFAKNGIDFGDSPPKVEVDSASVSRFDPFVPTGHYDWTTDTVTLRIDKRQAKDILRTYCHELVHAWQYRKNPAKYETFDKSGKLESNPELLKYEEEAYLKGNVLFRRWTESVSGR